MNKVTVFIDGKSGTTGLQIYERIGSRADVELITLPEDKRRDAASRREAINSADIVFLCLPDAAAVEAVSMVTNPDTVVIDASTAHRTAEGWVYGFPELAPEFEERIARSKRIAVPGCHASGFAALVYPLIKNGLISRDTRLVCHSLTGYSGGGKGMIAEYEREDRDELLLAPRQYALGQSHKHLREMRAISGLDFEPIFCPVVDNFYRGMEVTVPLFREWLTDGATAQDVRNAYASLYTGETVAFSDEIGESGFLSAGTLSGKDCMRIGLFGNEDRILPVALYDNLGKGASGAAVECMNIVLGKDKTLGLNI